MEWWKSERLTRILMFCWSGYKNGNVTLEKVCQFLINLSICLLCDPAIPVLGTYPRENKIHIQKELHTYIPFKFIHSSQTLERTPVVINERMGTHTMIQSYIRMLFSSLKNNKKNHWYVLQHRWISETLC